PRVSRRAPPPPPLDPLSLHDALPICTASSVPVAQDTSGQSASTEHASKPRVIESPTAATDRGCGFQSGVGVGEGDGEALRWAARSEEHTSELQSRENLVCRRLLEKKK